MKRTSLLELVCIGVLAFANDSDATLSKPQLVGHNYYRGNPTLNTTAHPGAAAYLEAHNRFYLDPVKGTSSRWMKLTDTTLNLEDILAALDKFMAGRAKKPAAQVQLTPVQLMEKIFSMKEITKDNLNFIFSIDEKFSEAEEGSIAKRAYESAEGKRTEKLIPEKIELGEEYLPALEVLCSKSYHIGEEHTRDEKDEDTYVKMLAEHLSLFRLKTSEEEQPVEPQESPANQVTINVSIIQQMSSEEIRYLIYDLQQQGVNFEGIEPLDPQSKPAPRHQQTS